LKIFEDEKSRDQSIVGDAKLVVGVPNRALIALGFVKIFFEAYCKMDFRFCDEDIPAIRKMVERYFDVKSITLYHGETFYVGLRREKKAERYTQHLQSPPRKLMA